MFIDTENKKVNITASEMVFLALRKRELFRKCDTALIDDPAFAKTRSKNKEEKEGNSYYPDTTLNCTFKFSDITLTIDSRSSIFTNKETDYTIDIVKSLRYPLKFIDDNFMEDWIFEGKLSAFILADKRKLEKVHLRISVYHTETLEYKNREFTFTYNELVAFFKDTVTAFSHWLLPIFKHTQKRNESTLISHFPFNKARDGQKEISKEIFTSVKNKNNVIINAPTGLGKTVAVLYPALKAQGKNYCNKVFYLTAKNSGNVSAVKGLDALLDSGFDVTAVVISAKNKICPQSRCASQSCTFTKDHHTKTLSAIFEIISNHKIFTAEIIKEYSQKFNICPFMLETELATFADVVICDYNYIFDPAVSSRLKSVLSGNDVILVDEAHNLIDRIRNIFKAELKIDKLSEFLSKVPPNSKLHKTLKSFIYFVKNDVEDSGLACESLSTQSIDLYEKETNLLYSDLLDYFENDRDNISSENFLDACLIRDSLKKFVEILTSRSDDYITFYNDNTNPEVFLVNTSSFLNSISKKIGTIVFFSATLFPEEYYKYMLGTGEKDTYVSFPSPFDFNRLLVLAYPISTKFSEREQTIEDVVRAIYTAGRVKTGNYIAFFPSYQYMNLALLTFKRLFPNEEVIYQKNQMTEKEKEDFLGSFVSSPNRTLFAFAVLGGVFSEGIDLAGDKLSGAAVVGLGSVPPSRKSALISAYFGDLFFDGDKFAYHYPGLNKVFQAGGRVIRSDEDRGYLLIIDDRFLTPENIELLPQSWHNIKKVKDNNAIFENLSYFWQKNF